MPTTPLAVEAAFFVAWFDAMTPMSA